MINTPYQSRGFAKLKLSGLKRRLGITQWREFSEDMTQGLKNLQESATYKRTAENLQFAKVLFHEFWENTIFKPLTLKVWSIAQICRTLRERRAQESSQESPPLPPSRLISIRLIALLYLQIRLL